MTPRTWTISNRQLRSRQSRSYYCTVNVTLSECVALTLVAVTTSVLVPFVVPGDVFAPDELPAPHPVKPPSITQTSAQPSQRAAAPLALPTMKKQSSPGNSIA
jgi:hypothetical protein